MILARLGRPFRRLLPTSANGPKVTPTFLRRIKAMLALAPDASCRRRDPAGASVFPAVGDRRGRVALLQGCAQQVLAPRINQAAVNLLTRHGIEVVLVKDEQCCGALTHHLSAAMAMRWRGPAPTSRSGSRRRNEDGLDAILVTASGCGTVIKDYGYMLREDREFAAARRADFRAGKGYHRVCQRHRTGHRRRKRAISPSPITPPVRCSTDRKSRSFRKNCFPRMDSW